MNRRKARKIAFILIFEYKFQPDRAEHNIDKLSEMYYDIGDQQEYIEDVVRGVIKNISDIDLRIEKLSKGWQISRISGVSLACMRLAMYEILYRSDVPAPVAIDQALNLVREFEGEDAISFVNGILGRLKTTELE